LRRPPLRTILDMRPSDRTKLLFGPCRVPALKRGDRATHPGSECVRGK
jgi:hypothetical protein